MKQMNYKTSQQQRDILTALEDCNVVVDSMAGSGKTTTCLEIARQFPSLKILLLTYNQTLQMLIEEQAKDLELDNIDVKYFSNKSPISSKRAIEYDIIIVDEVQDMKENYYIAFLNILAKNQMNTFKIALFGDQMQAIEKHKGGDSRFLTLADKIFDDLNEFPWFKLDLSYSFRITQQTAEFINNQMLTSARILSRKQGELPDYKKCNSFTNPPESTFTKNNIIFKEVMTLIKEKGYSAGDILILAPSLESKTNFNPIETLYAVLNRNRIPAFYPLYDVQLNEDKLKSKILFSTFNQAKGLERKIVIVYSFDSGYYKYYNSKTSTKCPNDLYVAVSRAQEKLIVIQDFRKDQLPFYKDKNIDQSNHFSISLTDLTQNISQDIIKTSLSFLDRNAIKISTEPSSSLSVEESNIKKEIQQIIVAPILNTFTMNMLNQPSTDNLCLKNYLQTQYRLLPEQQVQAFYQRIFPLLTRQSNLLEFRKHISVLIGAGETKKYLKSQVDCIDHDNKIVWEFKFDYGNKVEDIDGLKVEDKEFQYVDRFKDEDFLQFALKMRLFILNQDQDLKQSYQYLYDEVQKERELSSETGECSPYKKIISSRSCDPQENKLQHNSSCLGDGQHFSKKLSNKEEQLLKLKQKIENNDLEKYRYQIFYLQTNEIQEIKADSLNLQRMLNLLYDHQYNRQETKEDCDFIKKMKNTKQYKNTVKQIQKRRIEAILEAPTDIDE